MSDDVMRLYDDPGPDGYPPEWHRLPVDHPLLAEADLVLPGGIKDVVRALAGYRCVRCHHHYRGGGEWTNCDVCCTHAGPIRSRRSKYEDWTIWPDVYDGIPSVLARNGTDVQARWRVLTVHHLDGNKLNCRWWNLVALCQRCHLQIQGKVKLERPWHHEHTEWFRPYVAGYYGWTKLGEDLSRPEVEARLDELLALEDRQLELGAAE